MAKRLRVSTKDPDYLISGHFYYTEAIISACLFSAPIDIELSHLVRPQDNPAFT